MANGANAEATTTLSLFLYSRTTCWNGNLKSAALSRLHHAMKHTPTTQILLVLTRPRVTLATRDRSCPPRPFQHFFIFPLFPVTFFCTKSTHPILSGLPNWPLALALTCLSNRDHEAFEKPLLNISSTCKVKGFVCTRGPSHFSLPVKPATLVQWLFRTISSFIDKDEVAILTTQCGPNTTCSRRRVSKPCCCVEPA